MSVKDVSTESEFKKLTDNGLAIVKYSAEWCGPCKRVHPQYKELAKKNNEINFLHVDIDSSSESMPNQVSDIYSVPTFHFYKDGKVVDKLEGANINMLITKLERLKEKKSDKKDSNNDAKSSSSNSGEGGEVREVTTAKEYNEIIATGKTIVDFSAVWCMPCKILVPIFKKLAEEFKDIKFIKVDVDDNDDELASIINDLKIVAVPSFLFYHNNKLVERLAGGNAVVLRLNAEKLSAREETDSINAKESGEETKPKEKKEVEEGTMETGAEANEEEKEKDETAEAPKEEKTIENEEPVVEKKEEEKQETEEKKEEDKEETKETQNEVEPKKEAENDPKETQKESDKPVESKNNE